MKLKWKIRYDRKPFFYYGSVALGKQWNTLELLQNCQQQKLIENHAFDQSIKNYQKLASMSSTISFISNSRHDREHPFFQQPVQLNTLNDTFDAACEQTDLKSALLIYNLVIDFDYRPPLILFRKLLEICVKHSNLNAAKVVFDRLSYMGYKLDIDMYTCMIEIYASNSELSNALELLNRFSQKPTSKVFNALLYGYSKIATLESMRLLYNQMIEQELEPNHQTYAILIKFYGNQQRFEGALAWYRIMQMKTQTVLDARFPKCALEAEVITNEALILAACRSTNMQKVLELLNNFEKNQSVSIGMFITVIKYLARQNEYEKMELLFKRMEENGFDININMYEELIACLFRSHKPKRALDYIHQIVRKDLALTPSIYHSLIRHEIKRKEIIPALYQFMQLLKNKIDPKPASIVIIMEFISKIPPRSRNQSKKRGIPASTKFDGILQQLNVHYLSRLRNYKAVMELLFDTYLRYEMTHPTWTHKKIYHCYLEFCLTNQLWEIARKLLILMLKKSITPKLHSLDLFVDILIKSRGWSLNLLSIAHPVEDFASNLVQDASLHKTLAEAGKFDTTLASKKATILSKNNDTVLLSTQLEKKLIVVLIDHYLRLHHDDHYERLKILLISKNEKVICSLFKIPGGIEALWKNVLALEDLNNQCSLETREKLVLNKINHDTRMNRKQTPFKDFTKLLIRYCELNSFWKTRFFIILKHHS